MPSPEKEFEIAVHMLQEKCSATPWEMFIGFADGDLHALTFENNNIPEN